MKRPAQTRLTLLSALLPLLLAPVAAAPGRAHAEPILKCTGAGGITIFTDKPCEAFGARLAQELDVDGSPLPAPARGEPRDAPLNMSDDGAIGGFAIRGCARTQGELMAGVRESIARGDVNRLSNYYDWNGMGSSAAFATMDRLDEMVRNSAATAQFDYPQPTYGYSSWTVASVDTAADPYAAAGSGTAAYGTAGYSAAGYSTVYGSTPPPSTTVVTATPAANPAADPAPVLSLGQVVPHDGPSIYDAYRQENDDVSSYGAGIVDASTPLSEARPAIPADDPPPATTMPTADAGGSDAGSRYAAGSYNAYNPRPSALRVSYGGAGGHRFSMRQQAGCWFIRF